mmetsp:Transcript_43188/g.105663  ORF Transcript_43188/g.105663 Transcript_43188/m.105663 type:complete len:216 (+) Transcript_43188:473-1120(+)
MWRLKRAGRSIFLIASSSLETNAYNSAAGSVSTAPFFGDVSCGFCSLFGAPSTGSAASAPSVRPGASWWRMTGAEGSCTLALPTCATIFLLSSRSHTMLLVLSCSTWLCAFFLRPSAWILTAASCCSFCSLSCLFTTFISSTRLLSFIPRARFWILAAAISFSLRSSLMSAFTSRSFCAMKMKGSGGRVRTSAATADSRAVFTSGYTDMNAATSL